MTHYIDPRSKLLQHLDRIAALKNGESPMPVNVEIDLSNRCSLGCEWCHFGFTHTRGPLAGKRDRPQDAVSGGDLMDYELAQTIITDLSYSGVRSITWTGGGEPTLHPRFDDVISYAAMHGIDQGLYTHGGHILPKRAKMLKELCQWVYVSLDCISRDEYLRVKGADRFDEACNGVRRLANEAGKATIGVGFLIHADNYQRIPRMIDLGLSLGADYVQLRPAVHFDVNQQNIPAESTAWLEQAMPFIKGAAVHEKVIADLSRFEMYRDWRGHGYTRCYWAGLQTVITPDGSVWTCVNKREMRDAWLGNLSMNTFAQIWRDAGGCKSVDGNCRVLCRGHIPNVELHQIMQSQDHCNFI